MQRRGAGFGSLASTRVPRESLQRAPVLLLGTKTFLLPGSHPCTALSLQANYINGCLQPGRREGTVPWFPDVTLWPRTQPALALAGLYARFHSMQLLSTALWGGTNFSLLYLAAGTLSSCQVCVRGAASLGSAQGLAVKTSALG